MTKKGMIALLACLLVLLPMAAMAGGQKEAPAAEKMTIGVALDNLNDPFWLGIKKGIDDAGRDLGVDLVIRTAEGDAVKQNSQIDDMIAQGVSGIACVYVDYTAILQAVKACNKAGIPFVFCDRTLDSTADAKVAWGIATDNYALTVKGWEWMADYARKNGMKLKVLELVGSLSDENVLRRTDGFKAVMAKNSDIVELVQQVPTEWNLEKALAGATNALQAHPEINCVFMHSDYLLGATISALRQAGRYKKIGESGHVAVMPYSGNKASLDAMREGYVEMCFGMDVYKTGYEAVKAAVEIANGKTLGEPVLDAGFIITQENFDEMSKRAYGSF
ncbi:MAG: sugar ABC transporter substrate-binding protein [Spirochaetales bacterium]|nr:sugar ABC transporter substrate-binding protein [Spirochaetales bacterium]